MKTYVWRRFSITRLYRKISQICPQIIDKFSNNYKLSCVFFQSLFYNCQLDAFYCIDTIFDPLFYLIDNYLKYFGTVFVIIVFIILFAFISFAYIIGIPYWYYRSKSILIIALFIGHWLLINVIWNYFKSLYTLPGLATDKSLVTEVASFCKKCLIPKPPRCHHCSVCNKCILKMDHHCPWLNNCIGHYNHRYFYFFCAYTWFGTIFVMIFGVWVAVDQWFPNFSPFSTPIQNFYDELAEDDDLNFVIKFIRILNGPKFRTKLMIFEAIITILLFVLLGLLLRYHTILITNGETCIERYINRKCRRHYSQYNIAYYNPYDFGPKKNWRRFLGFDRNLNPWRHILLPSNFGPIGDGFTWKTATVSNEIC